MACARVHEAIAKEINKEYKKDEILLRIGTVAPDSWRNIPNSEGVKNKYLSHFWDYRKKEGQSNNYEEFYFKYYNDLTNPFYFGYLLHLIVDQYWKTNIDPLYNVVKDGQYGCILKDGNFHPDENWFMYKEGIKIQKLIAKNYDLGKLPIEKEAIPNLKFDIAELNEQGLFGEDGTLNYINKALSPDDNMEESILYDINDIINKINITVEFVKKELKRLEENISILKSKYLIAVDIDDTILCTKELEEKYWKIFINDNKGVDPNKRTIWGDPDTERFWDQYRHEMSFGKIKTGAAKSIKELINKGYIVDLLSARPIKKYHSLKKELVEYFEKNDLKYHFLNLGFYSKAQFLKEHNYDLLIDDDIRNMKEANKIGIQTILYGPYNSEYKGIQTDNWEKIPEIIEQLQEHKKPYSKNF